MEFRREELIARYRSPDGLQDVERRVDVRFDPLLGTSSRIAEGVRLQAAESGALTPIQEPDSTCPFCPPRLEEVTPHIVRSISPEARIRLGETLVFPNLVPYSQYAAVAVFSSRHWLSLVDFSPDLLRDNLAASLEYVRDVYWADSRAKHCAYNVNYLYPSGGSLPHPHAQIYVDPHPTTLLRLQQEAGERYRSERGTSFWEDLVEEEERRGERWVGRLETTAWMTAFAPLGFNEVRAVVRGRSTLLDLTDEDLDALACGIARVLSWYDAMDYNSFNLVLYSGPLDRPSGYRVNLCMVTRTALVPYYRSDAMYLERLHWEAAIDRLPEETAADLRARWGDVLESDRG